MNLVDRFLQYVKFDTQSDELTNLTPSTPGQMIFARHLKEELENLGLSEITLDENGYLMATLPGNISGRQVSTVGFIAHLDTSPDMSGRHVSPRIVENYDGGDIVLTGNGGLLRLYGRGRAAVSVRLVRLAVVPVQEIQRAGCQTQQHSQRQQQCDCFFHLKRILPSVIVCGFFSFTILLDKTFVKSILFPYALQAHQEQSCLYRRKWQPTIFSKIKISSCYRRKIVLK